MVAELWSLVTDWCCSVQGPIIIVSSITWPGAGLIAASQHCIGTLFLPVSFGKLFVVCRICIRHIIVCCLKNKILWPKPPPLCTLVNSERIWPIKYKSAHMRIASGGVVTLLEWPVGPVRCLLLCAHPPALWAPASSFERDVSPYPTMGYWALHTSDTVHIDNRL